MPHRPPPGPDRRSASPACTQRALRVPSHTHAAPPTAPRPAPSGNLLPAAPGSAPESKPLQNCIQSSLSHTHTHSRPLTTSQSRHRLDDPSSSTAAGSFPIPGAQPFPWFRSFSSSFIHSFTQPVTGPGPRVEGEQSRMERPPSRSTSSAGERR